MWRIRTTILDRPGFLAAIASACGDAGVNIADMVISREFDKDGAATALMVIKTDSAPPDALLNRLRARPNILRVKALVLPPRDACSPPAPKGTSFSEFEKKNRTEILSFEAWNSRSQLAVNWSSINRPGLLTANSPVWPGVPDAAGNRKPPEGAPNWSL